MAFSYSIAWKRTLVVYVWRPRKVVGGNDDNSKWHYTRNIIVDISRVGGEVIALHCYQWRICRATFL
jgi:hypothetical protein